MIKPSKVVFVSKELEDEFESLPENDPIKKSILRAIEDLKQNAFWGIQVPKRLIPQEYIQKYNAKNLWKYDLPNGWRLVYTIVSENEIDILSTILEWFDHKDYERRFNY
jgi:Txe/YoeB family toxin of Txe-Axe toxin-antitoxin module